MLGRRLRRNTTTKMEEGKNIMKADERQIKAVVMFKAQKTLLNVVLMRNQKVHPATDG